MAVHAWYSFLGSEEDALSQKGERPPMSNTYIFRPRHMTSQASGGEILPRSTTPSVSPSSPCQISTKRGFDVVRVSTPGEFGQFQPCGRPHASHGVLRSSSVPKHPHAGRKQSSNGVGVQMR